MSLLHFSQPSRRIPIRIPIPVITSSATSPSTSAATKQSCRYIHAFCYHFHPRLRLVPQRPALPQLQLPLPLILRPHLHLHHQQQRYKNSAKKGLHLQTLNEMAHTNERAAAEERRQKRKDKTHERKGKKEPQDSNTSDHTSSQISHDDSDNQSDKNNKSNKNNENDDDPIDSMDEMDTSVLPDPSAVKKKMMRHVDSFKEFLKTIRGGVPTAELFDGIMVNDAYGRDTGSAPLKAVAQVVISSPTLAVATCFDPATAKAVAKAIVDKLELNSQIEEGGTISIPLPRISMESRQQTAASLHKRTESYRQRIRQTRRTALDVVKQGVAGKLDGVSKDDAFRVQQEIESLADSVIKELNQVAEKKNNEIMSL